MGCRYDAICDCGYLASVRVGGGRSGNPSPYPFYCERCGLVEVDETLKVHACPKCGSTNVKKYGEPPISMLDPVEPDVDELPRLKPAFPAQGLCPSCKRMTLVFDGPTLLYG